MVSHMEASAPPPDRSANWENLAQLLEKFDKVEKSAADTVALQPRLESEIDAVLATGDVQDEGMANSLATKRGQLELIPAKLKQLTSERESLVQEIEGEFHACYAIFERRFAGGNAIIHAYLDRIVRPLMADDFMVEHHISMLVPHTKLNRSIVGLLSNIQFPRHMGNIPEAARQLLKRRTEAAEIIAGVQKLIRP